VSPAAKIGLDTLLENRAHTCASFATMHLNASEPIAVFRGFLALCHWTETDDAFCAAAEQRLMEGESMA